MQPVTKPGVCPIPGPGFVPFRSAANVPQADPGVGPTSTSDPQAQRRQERKEQRQQERKEQRQQQRREARDRSRREVNGLPWSRRTRRSPHHEADRNDRREVRLNRRFRMSGRAIRSADDGPRRVIRQSAGAPGGQGGAQPNQRFFPFCQSNCRSDFDCPGILKCCSGSQPQCLQCLTPF